MQNNVHQISMEVAEVCNGVENCESCRYYKYCVDEAVSEEVP